MLNGAVKLIESYRPLIAVECFTHTVFMGVELFLNRYGYFPIESANATPTFVFVSHMNQFHTTHLAGHLRASSLRNAVKYKGFDS